MELIAVIIARIGPYHAARMQGAARVLGRDRCVALEIASRTRVYGWDEVSATGFQRRTLFRDRDYEAIPGKARASALVSALEELQPTAVAINGWSAPEARAALRWCRSRKRTAILMSESQQSDSVRWKPLEWLKRAVVRQFDSALVGGRSHARYLEALGMSGDRIAYGYDVVDNRHFEQGALRARSDAAEVRRRMSLPERYFLASARFIEKKNLPFLVDAFARCHADAGENDSHLVVLGDGPERTAIEARIRAAGLHGRVHLPGFIQYGELPHYYGLAEAFVLPSLVEPWGLVVNEAMAAAIPVLVSRACGAAELVIEGENGFTFDPHDAGALARFIGTLERDAGLRRKMGDEGHRLISRHGPPEFGDGLRRSCRFEPTGDPPP
jgi:glycosyltransferase involved in cell wall biosynthesis